MSYEAQEFLLQYHKGKILRIDNGDLEHICTRLRIFSNIFVINQLIRT